MRASTLTATSVSLFVAPSTHGTLVGAKGEVSAVQFGNDWPFTVPAGRFICRPASNVFFHAQGNKLYAVNGAAQACVENSDSCSGIKAKDIDPIWKNDTKLGHGLKKNIGPLINAGLGYCERQGSCASRGAQRAIEKRKEAKVHDNRTSARRVARLGNALSCQLPE